MSSLPPNADDIEAFLTELRRYRERLLALTSAASAGDTDALASAIEAIREQLRVADKGLRIQHQQLLRSAERLAGAHEDVQPGTATQRRTPDQIQMIAAAAADIAGQADPALTVQHVAQQALVALPPSDEVGVILSATHGRGGSHIATGPLAADCNELQTGLGLGPALRAIEDSVLVRLDDVARDERWPDFAISAAQHGAGSILCVPLTTPRGTFGALTFYARDTGAFRDEDELIATAFATHAGIALTHADLEANLQIALRTREEVGRAVGILMERHRMTADAAFELLVQASQHSHRKLRDIGVWVCETGDDPIVLIRPGSAKGSG
jgi:GAF domain-containing protein